MLSRRVSAAISLPVLAAAFGIGVAAGLRTEEAALPARSAVAPVSVSQARPAPAATPSDLPHERTAAPLTPVALNGRSSVGAGGAASGLAESIAPERERSPALVAAVPDAAEGPRVQFSSEISIPNAALSLPAGPPEDLKPRHAQASPPHSYGRRIAPRRAGPPPTSEVPILGPLFGFKY